MRVAGVLDLDGSTLKFKQGGNSTTITEGTPSGDITLTLPITTDTLVGRATTDTLTNKTLTSPTITSPSITGASTLSINDNGSNDLILASSDGAFSADRTLSIDLTDANRSIDLAGDITLAGDLTTSGAYALTLTLTATTGITLPTTGTLSTLAGTETLTNKTLTSPTINSATIASPTVTTGILLDDQAYIRFEDDTGNEYVQLQASAGTTTHTYKWPTTQGAASEVLGNDGSGNLSWMAALTDALNDGYIFIGNSSNSSTAVDTASVGDIDADSTNGLTIKSGVIVNADINSSAAIDSSKLDLTTLADNNLVINDEGDATKELDFQLSGATTSTKTTIAASQTGNVTITLPDATDTLVGKATTDTLTNKTLTSPTITSPSLGTTDITAADHVYGALNAAGDPTFSFTGDTDTGLFSPGANIVAWATNATERARINDTGQFLVGTTSGTGADSGTPASLIKNNGNSAAILHVWGTNGSRTGNSLYIHTDTAAGSGYNDILISSPLNPKWRVQGDGQTLADGAYSSGGADFAEMFEWADGNPDNEDRAGVCVKIVDGKIEPAITKDEVIGVISVNPTAVGDSAGNKWDKQFLKDDFGRYILDSNNNMIMNNDYDPNIKYVPRGERKEWDAVGLVGKLRVKLGQPIKDEWIKLKSISDTVTEYLVRN